MIEAVLFDIDDTLVDTSKAFEMAIGGLRREYFPELPESVEPAMLETWYQDAGGQLAKYIAGEIDMITQRVNRASELNQKFGGAPVTPENFQRWDDAFWGTFYHSMQLYDDVVPLLDALHEKGIKVGVVTNASNRIQKMKLANAGLDADATFGKAFVGIDNLGFGKPDPQVFLAACRILAVAPENAVYVGDEPQSDAVGATEAGLRGVWLTRPSAHLFTTVTDEIAAKLADIPQIESLKELETLIL